MPAPAAQTFEMTSRIPASADRVFAWHEEPEALDRLVPPWDRVEIVERTGGIEDGARVVLRLRIGPFRRTWVARHEGFERGRRFRDVMEKGPFALWEHTHLFRPDGPDACLLTDRVRYAPPLGALGRLLLGRPVRRRLERTFAWRHEATLAAFAQ